MDTDVIMAYTRVLFNRSVRPIVFHRVDPEMLYPIFPLEPGQSHLRKRGLDTLSGDRVPSALHGQAGPAHQNRFLRISSKATDGGIIRATISVS